MCRCLYKKHAERGGGESDELFTDVKNEILRRKITRPCCCRAAAYAAACFGKYFDERGIVLQTETEGVAHFVQRMYSRCGIAGEVVRKERPAGPVFEFHVQEPEAVRKALELFGPHRARTGAAHPPGQLQMPELRVLLCLNGIFVLRHRQRP